MSLEKVEQDSLGFCTVCGEEYNLEDAGSVSIDRKCTSCTDGIVYSIVEYRDLAIDWERQKKELTELVRLISGDISW